MNIKKMKIKEKLVCIIGDDYSINPYSEICSKGEITKHLPSFLGGAVYHPSWWGKNSSLEKNARERVVVFESHYFLTPSEIIDSDKGCQR